MHAVSITKTEKFEIIEKIEHENGSMDSAKQLIIFKGV
jgi:hypothetical protein